MKKSSLNRKFRRALAASLGAVAFASTSCVINAVVSPMLIKQREVARYFADPAHINEINSGVNAGGAGAPHRADTAAQHINAAHIMIGGEPFALDDTKLTQKQLKKDYEFPMTLNGVVVGTVRLKRQSAVAGPGDVAKTYRLCPPNDTPIPNPGVLYLAPPPPPAATVKVSRWVQEKWHEYYTDLDNQIKALQAADAAAKRAEENARAERERERERAKALMDNSGNQTDTAPINNTAALTTAGLAAAMLPMNVVMNNPNPVQTTTPNIVDKGIPMGVALDTNKNINNNNPLISQNTQAATDKTKT